MRPAWTLARWVALATTVTLPLTAWPGLPHPFSTPKIWVLAVGAALVLALTSWPPPRGARTAAPPMPRPLALALLGWTTSLAWTAWLAPVPSSAPGVWLGLLGPAWVVALWRAAPSPRHMALAGGCAGTALAGVALLQAAGLDLFALLGWAPKIEGGSARLRVYGTLGNPNFVAAWLATQLPVASVFLPGAWPLRGSHGEPRDSPRRRPVLALALVAVLLPCAAVIATGSRGGALALSAGVATLGALQGPRARTWLAMLAVVGLVVGLSVSGARPLGQTLAGRVYIWRVLAAPAVARPVTGWGIGSIEVVYPRWEAEHFARSGDDEVSPFAGPQQRAHNDAIEVLVDRGLPGVLSLGLVAWAVACLWRGRTRVSPQSDHLCHDDGVPPTRCNATAQDQGLNRHRLHALVPAAYVASLAAFAVAGLVDFPLARPAEAAAAWTGVAMVALSCGRSPRAGVATSADAAVVR